MISFVAAAPHCRWVLPSETKPTYCFGPWESYQLLLRNCNIYMQLSAFCGYLRWSSWTHHFSGCSITRTSVPNYKPLVGNKNQLLFRESSLQLHHIFKDNQCQIIMSYMCKISIKLILYDVLWKEGSIFHQKPAHNVKLKESNYWIMRKRTTVSIGHMYC